MYLESDESDEFNIVRDFSRLSMDSIRKLVIYKRNFNMIRISESSFRDLTCLEELDIRCIRIKEIDTLVFENTPRLAKITLSINPNFKTSQKIENLQHFDYAKSLRELNLTGFTVEINRSLQMTSLTYLSLESCAIKKLPINSFERLLNLEHLNLRGNHLSHLSAGLFKRQTQLKSLNLSYNQLSVLDSNVLVGLLNAESIDFSYNFLNELKADTFLGLTRMKILNFHRNFIKFVHVGAFRGLVALDELDLSFNKFVELHSPFFAELQTHLAKLGELRLDMNRLNHALEPVFFAGFTHLKCLHLGKLIDLILFFYLC